MHSPHTVINAMLVVNEAVKRMENCNNSALKAKLKKLIDKKVVEIPHSALAHLKRIASEGILPVAEVKEQKCEACSQEIKSEEIDYLTNVENFGVCDNCLAFLYIKNELIVNPSEFVDKYLANEK